MNRLDADMIKAALPAAAEKLGSLPDDRAKPKTLDQEQRIKQFEQHEAMV